MVVETTVRDLLMDTTERLIAERGMTVSLREIAAGAGQRNNSAPIYHFGNYDNLLKATLARRMEGLERRRKELLADLNARGDVTLADVLRAIVEPALEIPYREGATHYARFVEQIRTHPVISHAVLAEESWPVVVALTRRLRSHMPALERGEYPRRIRLMVTTMFALMGDYERRGELNSPRGRKRAATELVAVLSSILTVSW
ncbi:hypothetical protein [Mycobacteroides abscessus]|uniref:hypothetical protein n=1 Tax=Mycobacteroides abscessus TaxID=36809 RepID=UPI000E68AA04|nr:hypothetical protein [Mycobacteroides abscessus]RIT55084.1 hypothetical protein D2E90_24785 [Mycobacteroides abscessus]